MLKFFKGWIVTTMFVLSAGMVQSQTIGGAVFGGARMADVTGKTTITVVNCDTISAVFGGNDIAGSVIHADGSSITLGTDAGNSRGVTDSRISIGSVYGGGNGYYAYDGSNFEPATSLYSSQSVAQNGIVKAMNNDHTAGSVIFTNTDASAKVLNFPTVRKTNITVTNNYVYVDSLFGGAKNAFVTDAWTSGDAVVNTHITLNGGTIYSVFGGNNWGGTLGASSTQQIDVNNTKEGSTSENLGGKVTDGHGHAWTGNGYEKGIRYLFGGGNKVAGQNVVINVYGGQIDTLFGGGNSADVLSTTVNVNVSTINSNYTLATSPYTDAVNYAYHPVNSVFDIRCLFGGNNAADMSGLPTLTLTKGGVHNVYGGGNKGIMKNDDSYSDNYKIEQDAGVTYKGVAYTPSYSALNGGTNGKRSTKVVVNSNDFIADTIYGGGQSAGTDHDTYVEIAGGHIGVVYGGTNIMGRVGPMWDANHLLSTEPRNLAKTNVYIHGGIIYNAVFGGSNGYYRCHDGEVYGSGTNNLMAYQYDATNGPDLRGKPVPAVFKTYVLVTDGATIKGSVFSSGNMAPVGRPAAASGNPVLDSAGIAILHIIGGTIGTGSDGTITAPGAVYGGGNMGNVFGGSDLRITGTTTNIYGDVYGGNNKFGRVFATLRDGASSPSELASASTNATVALPGNNVWTAITQGSPITLTNDNASTYTLITSTPKIWGSLYGGGNGDYEYVASYSTVGTTNKEKVVQCSGYEAIQKSSFVDINLSDGGYIAKVFGGGNSKTVGTSDLGTGSATVYLNCVTAPAANNTNIHVGSIFGGNNNVDMSKVPSILLLRGKAEKVYGGGNLGRMTDALAVSGSPVSSYVELNSTDIVITKDVYAGCNAADVVNHTYLKMRKGKVLGDIFGGNDAAGEVPIAHVVVDGVGPETEVRGSVYGGGNGNYAFYEYESDGVGKYYMLDGVRYDAPAGTTNSYFIGTIDKSTSPKTLSFNYHNLKGRPYVDSTAVVLTGNMVINNVYGGGISGDCRKTNVWVDAENGVFTGMIFGAGKGRVDNMGVRIGGDCKNLYIGVAQLDNLGNLTYGTGTAMGNVLDTAFLTISRFKSIGDETHRSAIFGGGQSGHVGTTYVVYEPTATNQLGALYLGCLASDVKNAAIGIIDAYEPTDEKWIIDTIYGGNDFTGRVERTDLTINSGTFTHVFGAGNGDVSTTGVAYINDNTRDVLYYKEWVESRSDLSDESDVLGNKHCNCYDTVPYSMDVKVTINGGTYLSTVYGGGNMGLVGNRDMQRGNMVASNNARHADVGHIELNIHDGVFHRHVFAGARGKANMKSVFFDTWAVEADASAEPPIAARAAAKNADNADLGKQLAYAQKILNMDGGHVMFSVYGGSEAVDDGFPYECAGMPKGSANPNQNTSLRPSTILNLTGGRVEKSLYGGGYQGNIYGSVYVNIGIDAVRDCPAWSYEYGPSGNTFNLAAYKPNLIGHSGYKMTNTYNSSTGKVDKAVETVTWTAPAGNTSLQTNIIDLEASVYNASDWGEAGDKAYFDTRGVFGGVTNILIDGKGYYTSLTDPINVGLPDMDIAYSIIGAGTSTDGGDINKLITLRHYGDYDCEPSKKIFSIQRANKVILDSAFVWMYGDQDAYSAYTSPSYSFCRIDTLLFRVDNVVLIEAPGLYVGYLASMRTDEVYRINEANEVYSKTPVAQDQSNPTRANDFLDNLWGTPGLNESCAADACDRVSSCDKIDNTRGQDGKPAAYNLLMMRNGSYLKISPFVDVTGPGDTPDGIDDGNHAFGSVYGWMFFMSQDESMSYIYASVKQTAGDMSRGGFVAPCYCDNFKSTTPGITNEIEYINVDANSNSSLVDAEGDYRTWKAGEKQGSRTRHIALVANIKPDNRLNYNLAGTNIHVLQADANGVSSEQTPRTVVIGDENGGDSLAYATTLLELPPTDGGSFYILNSVRIDQDNGGQMTLIEEGYEANSNLFFKSHDATATELDALWADPDYTFGLVFTGVDNFDNTTTNWNDGDPAIVRAEGFERSLVYGTPATPYQTWQRCVISGNDNLTIAGGYISKAIVAGAHGAIPTMQFTLTYHKRLSTTITRDVEFTFYEFSSTGEYIGPVNVTVTISTVIQEFSDLEAPVVAMFNEGVTNEYVRKITIPAGFLQRDIYIEGIEWGKDNISHYNIGEPPSTQDVTVRTDPNKATWFNMQAQTVAPPNNNNHFSIIVKPTESATESSNNTLGWYHIEHADGVDLYDIAREDWEETRDLHDNVTGNFTDNNRAVLYNSWDCMSNGTYIKTELGGGKGKGIWLGTLDGRSTASIDVQLNFNGLYYYHKQFDTPLAWITLKCHYYNTKTAGDGAFDIRIMLRTRRHGDTIYLAPEVYNLDGSLTAANQTLTRTAVAPDGTEKSFTVHAWGYGHHSEEPDEGPYPNYSNIRTYKSLIKDDPDRYLTSFQQAMKIYDEGDVLCILETMPITNGMEPISIMGDDYSIIQVIRYSGSHYKFPTLGCANKNAMIEVKNNGILSMRNIWLNGSGCTRVKAATTNGSYGGGGYSNTITNTSTSTTYYYYEDYPRVNALLWSNAPMVYVHEHGQVNMIKNVRMTNNFNNADLTDANSIGGGAVAVVRDVASGAVPSFTIGHLGRIYDNVVLDHAADNSYTGTYVNRQPRNYGAGAFVNGGYFTLGTGIKDTKIDISRNFYLKSSSGENTGVQEKTAYIYEDESESSLVQKTFQIYFLDTAQYARSFALSNVYLTRIAGSVIVADNPATTDVNESINSTGLIRYDNQSDVVYFLSEMDPTSRVGISKWFPGYYYENTVEPHYLDNYTERVRDTIMVARIGKGKSNTSLVDNNYNAGVFFNDSSYTAINGACAAGAPAFESHYPAVGYKYAQTTNPYTYSTENTNAVFKNFNDNVYVFRHTSLAPYIIYFQRCASFRKGVKQEVETMPAFVHLMNENHELQFNNYRLGDSIAYHWNGDATCALATDTIFFHVGGGFFPYTYTWSDISDPVNPQTLYTRQTTGSNAISRFGNTTYEKLRNMAQYDTMVMRLSVNTSYDRHEYTYKVTANDMTGHCFVEQDVKVRVVKVATDHHDDGIFMYDYENFLLHRKKGKLDGWQGMTEAELDAARQAEYDNLPGSGTEEGELFYRIKAPSVDSSSFHDHENHVPTHDQSGVAAEGGIRRAGYTHTEGCTGEPHADFSGKPYAGNNSCDVGDMTPRYLRVFRSFRVKPSIYPASARGEIVVKDVNDVNTLYTVSTADMSNDNWSPDIELCPGEVLNLHPQNLSGSSSWEFVGWNFDPSASQDATFVVGAETDLNRPTAFYVPGDYWWQVVTRFENHTGAPSDPGATAENTATLDDYALDYYGNVTIKTKKGLAWLISTVNGYNGQNAQTFHFNTITLDLHEGEAKSFDMQAHKWTPLGNANNPFEGTFIGLGEETFEDAQGNTMTVPKQHITNILVNETTIPLVGMFGQAKGATIKNFVVDSTMVRGNTFVSAICAEAIENTHIENTIIQRGAIFGEYCIGGFISHMDNSSLINNKLWYLKSNVDGVPGRIAAYGDAIYAGGFVGLACDATVRDNAFQNVGYIDISKLSAIYVGAFVGYNRPSGGKSATRSVINNNFARIVTSDKAQRVGGLVGYAENLEMNNNYVYGVTDYDKQYGFVGGIAGYIGDNVNISNCYYIDGMAQDMVGYSMGTLPQKSTTFSGKGNKVLLKQPVDGYTNLTRALNAWVRDNSDTTYNKWRSDLDGVNYGLPLFGVPDIIPVNDTIDVTICDEIEFDGITFDQSGVYVFHVVDSSDFVDSTLTVILTVNHGDTTLIFDTIDLGNDYEGNGFSISASEMMGNLNAQRVNDVYVMRFVDSLYNVNGCDSTVVLTLYVNNTGVGTPEVVEKLADVKVYPNPTLGIVNVEGSDLQSVEVYDNISRRVLSTKVEGDKTSFDLRDHAAGSYYVRVKTAHGTVVKKVIKK